MHEREFRAFVSVAETGRMDAAARQLGYSQPAITYQIQCLERSLGFKLFTRHPSGARLTSDGRSVLSSARAVLTLMENIRNPRTDKDAETVEAPVAAAVPMVRKGTA
ncbi:MULTISPECIES: LysR family transcriptional regulator [Streptomycetaceae]|uniref:LysR family transcriptional regulator n=1 Tax=unclassified Streptomyces TaxID=2593676 RepID=UPI0033DA7ACF